MPKPKCKHSPLLHVYYFKIKLQAKHGTVLTNGCIKETCRDGFWVATMNDGVCCHEHQAHKPNTIVTTTMADDCIGTSIECRLDGDSAKMVFLAENHCPKPATESHVDNQTQLLEAKIDKLNVKIEAEIDELGVKMEAEMDSLKVDMEANKEKLEMKMNSLEMKIENQTQLLEKLICQTGNLV